MPRSIELSELERKKLADAGRQSIPCTHGWRPINTAPKDGTPILVYDAAFGSQTSLGNNVAVAEFNAAYGDRSIWTFHRTDNKDHVMNATHWQPLPKLPTSIGETK